MFENTIPSRTLRVRGNALVPSVFVRDAVSFSFFFLRRLYVSLIRRFRRLTVSPLRSYSSQLCRSFLSRRSSQLCRFLLSNYFINHSCGFGQHVYSNTSPLYWNCVSAESAAHRTFTSAKALAWSLCPAGADLLLSQSCGDGVFVPVHWCRIVMDELHCFIFHWLMNRCPQSTSWLAICCIEFRELHRDPDGPIGVSIGLRLPNVSP